MDYKTELLEKLNDKLYNHDLDMDGFGNGYEQALNEAIELVENLAIHDVVVPKGTLCQTPKQCETSYYHQIGDYYCRKCEKTGLA